MRPSSYASSETVHSSSFTARQRSLAELFRLSRTPKKNGATSTDEKDHEEFDKRLGELEKKAREHAIQLKRIEIELGIFKPNPQIIDNH